MGSPPCVWHMRSIIIPEQPYDHRVYDLGDSHGCCIRTIRTLFAEFSREATAAVPCFDESPRHARRNLPDHCPAPSFYGAILEASEHDRGHRPYEAIRGEGGTKVGDGRCGRLGSDTLNPLHSSPYETFRPLPYRASLCYAASLSSSASRLMTVVARPVRVLSVAVSSSSVACSNAAASSSPSSSAQVRKVP